MSCYLCHHTEFKLREGMVRDDPSLAIRECDACGLVYLSSIAHIKHGHYEDSGMHAGAMAPLDSWLRETEHDDQRRLDALRTAIANRRLLDFGCGAGGFLRKAQSVASQVVGLELERRVREYWGDRLRIQDSFVGLNKFDLITAFHVIEHLPDPREMLSMLAEHLDEGGRLVIEVPSSDDALLTLYESSAFQRFTYWSQHLYLFNAETLRRLAQQAGLKVVSVQQYQRYPLSNHLHWLSRGKPGGHQVWGFMDTPELGRAYANTLAAIGKCDSLVAHLERAD